MDSFWAEHALGAWDAIASSAMRTTWRGLRVLDGPGGRSATLWPLSQVLWAAAEVHAIGGEPPIAELTRSLERFRRGGGFAASPRGRRYFDDNAWVGLASLRLAEVTGDRTHLERGCELAAFVRTGEHPDGGVAWVEGREAINTCSTASSAWLALEAEPRCGDPAGRAFAERSMDWLDATLLRRDGLYGDHVEGGEVVRAAWSYNQGAAIAAARQLGRDPGRTVERALSFFHGDRLWREPPAFAVILFRALLEDPDARSPAIAALDGYVGRLLEDGLDAATGFFTSGGIGSYDGRPTIDQAAVTQLLAFRAWV